MQFIKLIVLQYKVLIQLGQCRCIFQKDLVSELDNRVSIYLMQSKGPLERPVPYCHHNVVDGHFLKNPMNFEPNHA